MLPPFFMRIFLIGFMGSGKTFLGKKLSSYYQLPFLDLDNYIEQRTNKTINELFAARGESYFRKLESKTLKSLNVKGIIATGGGIIELKRNRQLLQKTANYVIWLNPDWHILKKRILNSNRPLVKKYRETELYDLWSKRFNLYKSCANVEITKPSLSKIIKVMPEDIILKDKKGNKFTQ